MSDIKPEQKPEPIRVPVPKSNIQLPAVHGLDTEIMKNLSQEEIDREASIVRLQGEKLKLQREMLEIEKLTSDINRIRAERASEALSAETVQESLAYARQDLENHQNLCTHMKGATAESMLHNAPAMGTDSGNYAFIDHTFTHGVRFRMCQRCGKTWFPGDGDYRWAMSRPTRNSPSTGCPSPGLVQDRKKPVERGGVRLVSEIPHKIDERTKTQQDVAFGPGPAGF